MYATSRQSQDSKEKRNPAESTDFSDSELQELAKSVIIAKFSILYIFILSRNDGFAQVVDSHACMLSVRVIKFTTFM